MTGHKLYVLIGKSASGKDTVMRRAVEMGMPRKVTHTTRPMREGETEGVEYYFETNESHAKAKEAGEILEERVYNTVHGPWYYWTGTEEITSDTVTVSTVDGYMALCKHYGDNVIPIVLSVPDGVRMQRLLEREERQPAPNYKEIVRRFIEDEKDFGLDKLFEAGIAGTSHPCETEEDIDDIMRLMFD